MPAQPAPPQESFADLAFPDRGIDLARGYGQQLPGTTPAGVNVRTYEALTQRGRGGTRPGLVQFIPQALPLNYVSGLRVLQHLNLIVDPQTKALTDTFEDPSPDAVSDPSSPGSSQDWGYVQTGTGGYAQGTTRNPGRKIRKGGRGHQPSKNRKNKRIYFVQAATARTEARTTGQQSVAFASQVFAGHLIFVVIHAGCGSSAGGGTSCTVAVTDTQGNAYTQLASNFSLLYFATSGLMRLSLWYAFASAGPLTVLWTPSAAASSSVAVLEYGNVDAVTTVDAVPHVLAGSDQTPSIPVNVDHDAVLAVLAKGDRFITAYAAGAGFTNRATFPFNTSVETGFNQRSSVYVDDATDTSVALADVPAVTRTISNLLGVGLSVLLVAS